MTTYIVKLNIRIGEYVKITTHLVQAPTADEAQELALLNECHHDDFEDDGQGIYDAYGEFYYKLHSCKEVATKDVVTLNNYL